MPGVPSSRGCQQCRKQKKKCIATPSSCCQRCLRLKLPCLGLGQQRYKFIVEEPFAVTKATRTPSPPMIESPLSGLHNESTRLLAGLIKAVDPTVGIDISLTLNFGGFLVEVPRRLGSHKALDAAASAFVTAFAWFRGGRPNGFDAKTFRLHGRALQALRLCLGDPVTAHSSETLCAIQLIMIYHSLLGSGPYTSHTPAVAQILRARGCTAGQNAFEDKILLAQRGEVVIEALFNDRIYLTEREWKDLVVSHLEIDDIDGPWLRILAHLPNLMHRARAQVRQEGHLSGAPLASFVHEIRTLRAELQPCVTAARAALHANDLNFLANYTGSPKWEKTHHAICSRRYGIILTAGMILNTLGANFSYSSPPSPFSSSTSPAVPGELDFDYAADNLFMALETLHLADVARQYKPLGSMYMILCLTMTCVATDDAFVNAAGREMLSEFRSDFWSGPQPDARELELGWMRRRFMLSEVGSYEDVWYNYT